MDSTYFRWLLPAHYKNLWNRQRALVIMAISIILKQGFIFFVFFVYMKPFAESFTFYELNGISNDLKVSMVGNSMTMSGLLIASVLASMFMFRIPKLSLFKSNLTVFYFNFIFYTLGTFVQYCIVTYYSFALYMSFREQEAIIQQVFYTIIPLTLVGIVMTIMACEWGNLLHALGESEAKQPKPSGAFKSHRFQRPSPRRRPSIKAPRRLKRTGK